MKRERERGAGLMEILCVMALLLLFGITTYVLVTVGGDSYRRLLDKRDANANLRIATGYLGMRMRQYDVSGCLSAGENEQGAYLALRETIDGEAYETRVYLYQGMLCEQFMAAEDEFIPESGLEIVALDSFAAYPDAEGRLCFQVSYEGRERTLSLLPRTSSSRLAVSAAADG